MDDWYVKNSRYFEDVTDTASVNMDIYDGDSKHNPGTHTFGASFTVTHYIQNLSLTHFLLQKHITE